MMATSVTCDGGEGVTCSTTGCLPRRCQMASRFQRCQAAVPPRPPSSSTTSHTRRRRPLRCSRVDVGGVAVAHHSPCWTDCSASAMVPSPLHTTPPAVVHWYAHLGTGSMKEDLLCQKALRNTSD